MANEPGSNGGLSGMAVAFVAIFVMLAVFFIVFWILYSKPSPMQEQMNQPSTRIEIMPPEISPPNSSPAAPQPSPAPGSSGIQY